MNHYAEIQISQIGLKSRSKKEVYDLLWNEGDIYLPPIRYAYHKFISQVIIGEKKLLKCSAIKVCRVPHLKHLRVEDLLAFGAKHINIDDYIPLYNYHKLPNREWLANVLNTLVGQKFKDFTEEKICARVKHIVNKKKLNVMALPEFINIFKKTKNISGEKGRSHYLIKASGIRNGDKSRATKRITKTNERDK